MKRRKEKKKQMIKKNNPSDRRVNKRLLQKEIFYVMFNQKLPFFKKKIKKRRQVHALFKIKTEQ